MKKFILSAMVVAFAVAVQAGDGCCASKAEAKTQCTAEKAKCSAEAKTQCAAEAKTECTAEQKAKCSAEAKTQCTAEQKAKCSATQAGAGCKDAKATAKTKPLASPKASTLASN